MEILLPPSITAMILLGDIRLNQPVTPPPSTLQAPHLEGGLPLCNDQHRATAEQITQQITDPNSQRTNVCGPVRPKATPPKELSKDNTRCGEGQLGKVAPGPSCCFHSDVPSLPLLLRLRFTTHPLKVYFLSDQSTQHSQPRLEIVLQQMT